MSQSTLYKNNLKFGLSPEQIGQLTDSIIEQSRKTQDTVAAIPEHDRTFANVVLPLAMDEGKHMAVESSVTFPSYVYENKEARDAGSEAESKLSDFAIESGMRTDVYTALKTVQAKQFDQLSVDEQRLLTHMIRDYERNGLGLPEQEQKTVKELKQRLSKICIEFTKNLGEDKTQLLFTEDELEGCPSDFLSGLKRDEATGSLIVTLKYPDVIPVMKYAKKPETRKKLDQARSSQCQEQNEPLFEEALKLRKQISSMLGFDTHADYILDIRMAKNKENVMQFLTELRTRLTPGGHRELEKLKELKKTNEYEVDADQINSWDYAFYDRLLNERDYQVDDNLIKDYFPFEHTFNGLLSIAQDTFGLKFEEQALSENETWYSDVKLYNVFDAETGDFTGQFYIDLYPREGKYGHFAAFPMQPHYIRDDGTEQHPVSAMVCNFPKPRADAPSLLKHSDVVTLFHEFGHLMHGFCTKAKYARFSGTSVERDFVEMPSQFMENYCYEAEALKSISKHYKTGEPLSDELIGKIIAAKNAGVSLFNLRQLFFGFFDMACHTSNEPVDSRALYAKLKQEISLVPNIPGTNGAASFGHLLGGYDASYYGYLYSEVFSADMFNAFKQSGSVFNKDVGKKYRKIVLQTGGMKDGIDILKEFLGREPSQTPFLESIGLKEN